jgi:hypothetical protein
MFGPFACFTMFVLLLTAFSAPAMVIDGRDFYGRLVMPDHPNTTWCQFLNECAGAIDRKYGEVNVLFVNRCSVPAAKWWTKHALPYRTLFAAGDLDSYFSLATFPGNHTVVSLPFNSSKDCVFTYEMFLFRTRLLCDLVNNKINVIDHIMPTIFGTGLNVPIQDIKCDVPGN